MRLGPVWAIAFVMAGLASALPSAAQSEPVVLIEDPAQDVTPRVNEREQPVVHSSAFDSIDVRKVRIAEEDVQHLTIEVQVAELILAPVPRDPITDQPIGRPMSCDSFSSSTWARPTMGTALYEVGWRHQGTGHNYAVKVSIKGDAGAGGRFELWPETAFGCLERCKDERRCSEREIRVQFDAGSDVVRFSAPKAFMQFQDNRALWISSPDEFRLMPGDVLEEWSGSAHVDFRSNSLVGFASILVSPKLADSFAGAKEYRLTHPAADSVVRLVLDDGAQTSAVLQDAVQTYKVTVLNRAAEKRLLRLSYDLQAPPGWEVAGPPSVALPGKSVRNLTLTLTVPTWSPVGAELVVRAESAGFPDETAQDNASLVSVFGLRGETDKMYLHNMASSSSAPLVSAVFCEIASCGYPRLSFAPQDPRAASENEFHQRMFPGMDAKRAGRIDAYSDNVPIPFILNRTAAPTLSLTVKSETPISDARIEFEVKAHVGSGEVTLATFQGTAAIGTQYSTIRLDGRTPKVGPAVIPKGTYMRVHARLEDPSDVPLPPSKLWIKGASTFVQLPLLPLPTEDDPTVLQKAFQWVQVDELDEFANPGDTRLFEVALLNHRAETHVASLRFATPLPEGWSAEIKPGTKFELESGAVIRLGIPVRVPANAQVGDRLNLTLEVRDEANQTSTVTLRLLVIDFDVPDDGHAYNVDEEAAQRIVLEAPPKTPGFALVSGLAACALALWRRRTQRGA